MSASPERRRKSMAAPVCAVGVLSANWLVNRATLVREARSAVPFAGVNWDSPVWNVSETYRYRTRGYKADELVQRLLFTQHSPGHRVPGAPLGGVFGDVVKALVCMRHRQRGQSAGSHMVFVRAARYVFDALVECDHDICELTAEHLDAAAAVVHERERESTAYKVFGHMEEFADAPQKNRLPDEDAIRAIGYLYQHIPRGASPTEAVSGDRIMILIATVMVCTGLRIGEMLTLPEHPLTVGRDGSRILRYARLKGRADEVCVEWENKPLMTETEQLVEEALDELHEATEGARQVAGSFHETGRLLPEVRLEPEIAGPALLAVLGLRSRAITQFLRAREIPFAIRGKTSYVTCDALLQGLVRDHWTLPVIPGPPGQGVLLHEAM